MPQGVCYNQHFSGQNPVNESSIKSLMVDASAVNVLMVFSL